MLTITNIDFKQKIQSVECSGNFKDIQMSLIKNTFCVKVIYNEGETITTEYTKPKEQDTIEEVNINLFDKETEDNQREQVNISCKVEEPEPEPEPEEVKEEPEVKEEQQEEVKEEPEVKEEQQEEPKDKLLSIDGLKEILTENLEKRNTALSYGRTIKQVYDYFQMDEIYSLLQKEQDIIDFIEDKYKTNIHKHIQ